MLRDTFWVALAVLLLASLTNFVRPHCLGCKFNQGEVVTDVLVCFSACTNDIILNTKGLRVSRFIIIMPPIKTRVNFS